MAADEELADQVWQLWDAGEADDQTACIAWLLIAGLVCSMISIGTFEQLQSQNHALALYCVSCDRWGEANLGWLIKIGKGDKPVAGARFRCQDCGEIVEKQVRPPVPTLGGAVGYI